MSIFENQDVMDWIFGKKKFKDQHEEKKWGLNILQQYFNESKNTNQWTTSLGEHLVEEYYKQYEPEECIRRLSKEERRSIGNKNPDFITKNLIVEVKTRTYKITGTAGDKIYAVPFLYSHIPSKLNRKLKIVLVGYQEIEAQKNLEYNCPIRKSYLELFKNNGVEFIYFSSLFKV